MKVRRIVTIGVFLLALNACGTDQRSTSAPKIYGGKEVPVGDWSNVVALAFNRGGDFYVECTGTAITPQVILTAGHCLDEILEGGGPQLRPGLTWDDFGVYIGSGIEGGKLPADTKFYRANQGFVHEKLRALPRGNADIGLLILTEAISEPLQLQPLLSRIDESQFLTSAGTIATLVGYGQREDLGRGRKFEVEVPIVDVAGAEVLVGGNEKDSCSGDSGGPLFVKLADGQRRLAGVVSRGLNLSCGKGGIATLTPDYICWIQKKSGLQFDASIADTTEQGCELDDHKYDDKKLQTMSFLSVCRDTAAGPMQRHTVNAITLKLGASSCEDAAVKLSTASTLDLRGMRIRDLSPLANTPKLRSLNLEANKITDAAVLRTLPLLMTVTVAYNDIADFSPLAEQISYGLIVRGKRLQASNFLDTEFRRLCDNHDATPEQQKTVRAIRSRLMTGDCERANLLLARQMEFRIANRQLRDLTAFKNLENLTNLDLSGNPIENLAPLAECENLKVLDLTDTNVTDISPLVELLARGLEIRRGAL